MKKSDKLAQALMGLPATPLAAAFATKVRDRCRAALVPSGLNAPTSLVARLAIAGALVPGLLLSSGIVQVIQSAEVAAKAYPHRVRESRP